MEQIILICY